MNTANTPWSPSRLYRDTDHSVLMGVCAGIAPFNDFLEIDEALVRKVMEINFFGPFYVTQVCVPDMIAAKWGRIINITSSSVQSGSAMQTHYTSSKGALLGFTKCLAMALGERVVSEVGHHRNEIKYSPHSRRVRERQASCLNSSATHAGSHSNLTWIGVSSAKAS